MRQAGTDEGSLTIVRSVWIGLTALAAAACLVAAPAGASVVGELPEVQGVPTDAAEAAPAGPGSEPAAPGEASAPEPAAPADPAVEAAQSGDEDAGDDVEGAGDDRDCGDFSTQQDAQDYFDDQGGDETNNVDNLDADGDGIACEDLASTPTGGVDTGGGGTALPPDSERDPASFVLGGALGGFLIGVLGLGLRRRQTV